MGAAEWRISVRLTCRPVRFWPGSRRALVGDAPEPLFCFLAQQHLSGGYVQPRGALVPLCVVGALRALAIPLRCDTEPLLDGAETTFWDPVFYLQHAFPNRSAIRVHCQAPSGVPRNPDFVVNSMHGPKLITVMFHLFPAVKVPSAILQAPMMPAMKEAVPLTEGPTLEVDIQAKDDE